MIRHLEVTDYYKGYILLLNQLTSAENMDFEYFQQIFEQRMQQKIDTLVCELDNKIIATASIMIEHKFIHGGKCVGHIEDVVVDKDYRSNGYAKKLINRLLEIATDKDCYKVILDCNTNLIDFYSLVGFKRKEIQMVKYF